MVLSSLIAQMYIFSCMQIYADIEFMLIFVKSHSVSSCVEIVGLRYLALTPEGGFMGIK